jgi:hypothetical protein
MVRRTYKMPNWNRNKQKRLENHSESATKSTPNPGDYPVGSLESRAAARALVKDRAKGVMWIQYIDIGPNGERTMGPKIKVPPVQRRPA